jgi:hypothetical protein
MSMRDEPFTLDEQALIQRLRSAPQRTLKPQTREAIREQVIQEMDRVIVPAPRTRPGWRIPTLVAIAIVIISIVVITVIILLTSSPHESPRIGGTSATAMTATAVPATLTPTLIPTDLPAVEATSAATAAPTKAPTPDSTPQPIATGETGDFAPLIVIEGPVQAVNSSGLTVFDTVIRVEPGDPVLSRIQIGDTVHVEGNLTQDSDTLIIVAVNITIVNGTIVNGTIVDGTILQGASPGSPSLPPNCKISKNGHIKCSKKASP